MKRWILSIVLFLSVAFTGGVKGSDKTSEKPFPGDIQPLSLAEMPTTAPSIDQSAANPKLSYTDGIFHINSIDITETVLSKYAFELGNVVYDNGPVSQTDILISNKKGGALEVFFSSPFKPSDFNQNYGTELELKLIQQFEPIKRLKDLHANVSIAYDDLYPVGNVNTGDFVILAAEAWYDFHPNEKTTITPFIREELDVFRFQGVICTDSTPKVGMKFTHLFDERLSIGGKVQIINDPGVFGNEPAWVANVDLGFFIKVNEELLIEAPHVRYIRLLNDMSAADPRDQNGFEVRVAATWTPKFLNR